MIRNLIALSVVAAVVTLAGSASARQWKPSVLVAAQDYLRIEHAISDRERIIIFWIAPQFLAKSPKTKVVRYELKRFTMISMLHFTVSDKGKFIIRDTQGVSVEADAIGPLKRVTKSEMSPLLVEFVDAFTRVLGEGMGQTGSSIKTTVYDSANLDSCETGALWVKYLEEKYEFKTPVPGCE